MVVEGHPFSEDRRRLRSCLLPADAIPTLKVLVAALAQLMTEIGKLDTEITHRAKENELARRLMAVPGIGPLIATAIATLTPPPETFRRPEILRLGSGLWLAGIRPAANSGWGPRRRWPSGH
ncbi:hypothetical protein NBRC116599_41950 [Aquicoccus sp. SU-CL01552]